VTENLNSSSWYGLALDAEDWETFVQQFEFSSEWGKCVEEEEELRKLHSEVKQQARAKQVAKTEELLSPKSETEKERGLQQLIKRKAPLSSTELMNLLNRQQNVCLPLSLGLAFHRTLNFFLSPFFSSFFFSFYLSLRMQDGSWDLAALELYLNISKEKTSQFLDSCGLKSQGQSLRTKGLELFATMVVLSYLCAHFRVLTFTFAAVGSVTPIPPKVCSPPGFSCWPPCLTIFPFFFAQLHRSPKPE